MENNEVFDLDIKNYSISELAQLLNIHGGTSYI